MNKPEVEPESEPEPEPARHLVTTPTTLQRLLNYNDVIRTAPCGHPPSTNLNQRCLTAMFFVEN